MAIHRRASTRGGLSGITDFAELPQSIRAEWSFWVIRASVEDALRVARTVCRPAQVWDRVKPEPLGEFDVVSPLSALIGLAASEWVVVVRSVCYVNRALMYSASEEARASSSRLGTDAIAMWAESTSGSISYERFGSGLLVEMAEWDASGITSWASRLRSQPKAARVPVEDADELLRDAGVHVPGCYPIAAPKCPRLIATEPAMKVVERASIFEIPDRVPPSFAEMLRLRQSKLAEAAKKP
jgi:hypothetical protein